MDQLEKEKMKTNEIKGQWKFEKRRTAEQSKEQERYEMFDVLKSI